MLLSRRPPSRKNVLPRSQELRGQQERDETNESAGCNNVHGFWEVSASAGFVQTHGSYYISQSSHVDVFVVGRCRDHAQPAPDVLRLKASHNQATIYSEPL